MKAKPQYDVVIKATSDITRVDSLEQAHSDAQLISRHVTGLVYVVVDGVIDSEYRDGKLKVGEYKPTRAAKLKPPAKAAAKPSKRKRAA